MEGKMEYFVWSKMQAEAGQPLDAIIARKEAERIAGNGIFWWGIGSSLGKAVIEAAKESGGELPALFSKMLSKPKKVDSTPSEVWLWTAWKNADGDEVPIPNHVLVSSRSGSKNKTHYALVCRSSEPLALGDHGPFDPSLHRTPSGKRPDRRQVTALLKGNYRGEHNVGQYRTGFRAVLVDPFMAKLVGYHMLTSVQRERLNSWKTGDNWENLIRFLKTS
jgi:hypothetical protein